MSDRTRMSISRKLTLVLSAALVGVGANAGALWWSIESAADSRRENCERVADTFDRFTDHLITAGGAQGTEEGEAFRTDAHALLDDCT